MDLEYPYSLIFIWGTAKEKAAFKKSRETKLEVEGISRRA
jgi:hypothetical protein